MQLLTLLRSFLLLAASAVPSFAQCTPQWQPGDPMLNMHGAVNASVSWDPDGTGPSLPVLVVGGSFSVQSLQTNIAMFDGSQWASLGSLPASTVTALAVYGTDLVAAGPAVGSPGVSRVWRWSGGSWLPLGAPGSINGSVAAMIAFNGWLVIGGSFPTLDGLNLHSLAKWDGTGWSAVGSSFVAGVVGSVKAFAVFNGELHVGGDFTQVTTVQVNHYAVFNGGLWVPGAVFNAPIETLAVRTGITASSNYLLAGGSFTTVSNQASGVVAASHVARMQSTGVWSAVGAGLGGTKCTRLCVRATSLLGYEVMASVEPSPSTMWQWGNSTGTWTNVGAIADTGDIPTVTTIGLSTNQFVLGLQSANRAMRTFASSNWDQPLAAQGIGGAVVAQCMLGPDLVIAGSFDAISGVPMHNIARGHANAWQPLGGGLTGGFGGYAVAALPNGDLVAAGSFTAAGGVPANNIARWNGTTWAPLGNGFGGASAAVVLALCVMPNGDLIAGGLLPNSGPLALQNLARWNGTTWSSFGGANGMVRALTRMPNGDVVAGGAFTSIGGLLADHVARWDGGSWVAMGFGLSLGDVNAVVGLPDGSVVAGGMFAWPSPYCARWNGASWVGVQSFGFAPNHEIQCLTALPDGDVVAGGAEWTYTSSLPPAQVRTNLARLDLNGSVPTWSSLDVHGAIVMSVATLPDGSLSAVGEFDFAGPQISSNVARLVPPCPALATSSGVGCSGCTLTATTLPWVDATFRAKGTNLPTTAFVVTATSVTSVPQGVQPLAGIFAQGQPGCDLLVAPDILDVLFTTNGTATSSLFLAATPSLVGATFFQQMISLALNAQGAWTSITATNALRLTAGIL